MEQNPCVKKVLSETTQRSGILEHYTYKSDNGELLEKSNLKINYKVRDVMIVPKLKYDNINVKKYLRKRRSLDLCSNQIRTEHCDSTTDISENVAKRFAIPKPPNNTALYSDCEIIGDINKSVQFTLNEMKNQSTQYNCSWDNVNTQTESTNMKVFNWITKANNFASNAVTHVISDSEDESNESKHAICFNNDKNDLNEKVPENIYKRLEPYKNITVLPGMYFRNPAPLFSNLLPNPYLPSRSNDSLALINEKYNSVKNQLNSQTKTPLKIVSPKEPDKNAPKPTAHLSPESMKSELYTYLKINKKTLDKKVENVAQNRRSIRVRNLIEQIEKSKGKEMECKEDSPKTDEKQSPTQKVKKTFEFPAFPEHHNIISDFSKSIETYFISENINYKKLPENNPTTPTSILNELIDSPVKSHTFDRKSLKFEIQRKRNRQKLEMRKLQINAKFATDLTLRRLRFKPNRFRNSIPLTRHSLDGYRRFHPKQKSKISRQKQVVNEDKLIVQNTVEELLKPVSPLPNKSDKVQIKSPSKDNKENILAGNIPALQDIIAKLLSSGINSDGKSNSSPRLDITEIIKALEESKNEMVQAMDEQEESDQETSPCFGFITDTPNNSSEKISSKTDNSLSTKSETTLYTVSVHNYMEGLMSPKSNSREPEVVDSQTIQNSNPDYIPFNQNIRTKSFHRSLVKVSSKPKVSSDLHRSSDESPKSIKNSPPRRSLTHQIDINKQNGAVLNTYYKAGMLIIVQEQLISFWKQTALGHILGVQNMWLAQGSLQRIVLDPGCINRRSSEMVLSTDNSLAYAELWTKEHKFAFRECPIADVFATVYFHRGHGQPDKKVLQLENIKGYGDDVRFVVTKHSREIIVSWRDTFSKPIKTLVRSYELAKDFQTISSIKEMQYVSHYISSLHNIEDCDELILAAGDEHISIWNLPHGYLVTTLDMSQPNLDSSLTNKSICLYAQCDTGFLFLLQQINKDVLRLVAVNGITNEWKQLHSYQVPENYKELLGIVVESGILMTCYMNGFLCWDMNTGRILAEIDTTERIVLPCHKYLVAIDNYHVTVKHVMSYILSHEW